MVARYSDGPKYDAGLMNRVVAEADELREDALALAEPTRKPSARSPRHTGSRGRRSGNLGPFGRDTSALAGAARPPADVVRTALQLVSLAEYLLPPGTAT